MQGKTQAGIRQQGRRANGRRLLGLRCEDIYQRQEPRGEMPAVSFSEVNPERAKASLLGELVEDKTWKDNQRA